MSKIDIEYAVFGHKVVLRVDAQDHYASDPKVIEESIHDTVVEHLLTNLKIGGLNRIAADIHRRRY